MPLSSVVSSRREARPIPLAVVVTAGLAMGLSDIVFANIVAAVRTGRFIPWRVFQSVAAGVLGPSAFERGLSSAVLGAALHFSIAVGWCAIFVVLVRGEPRLRDALERRGGIWGVGAAFGMLVWLTMNFAVIPLSRARVTSPTAPVFWVMLVGHAVFVGWPAVLATRRAWAR